MSDVQAFSTEEWLAALQEAMRPEAGAEAGKTVRELVNITGIKEKRIRELIAKLQAQGRITVRRAVRTGIDGRAAQVPVYLIIGGEGRRDAETSRAIRLAGLPVPGEGQARGVLGETTGA